MFCLISMLSLYAHIDNILYVALKNCMLKYNIQSTYYFNNSTILIFNSNQTLQIACSFPPDHH